MKAREQEIQEELTANFIAADPIELILFRSEKVETEEGGYTKSAAEPLSAQTVRVVVSKDNDTQTAADGTIIVSDVVVIGMPTLDIKPGDTFVFGWSMNKYQVTAVDDVPTYERKAEAHKIGRG